MIIYLARHGEAETGLDDFARRLSERGRADVERVADYLKDHKSVDIARAVYSGKLRAQQTAEILADRLMRATVLEAIDGIKPNDPPAGFLPFLDETHSKTLVVGHLPFMGELVSLLLTGDTRKQPQAFEAGTVACLENTDGEWRLNWVVHPSEVK